jgi:hypothetical protein
LALSALADTTFVVFPLGSFIAASLAEVNFRIDTWLQKRCFLLYEDLNENDCAGMTIVPKGDRLVLTTHASLHNV